MNTNLGVESEGLLDGDLGGWKSLSMMERNLFSESWAILFVTLFLSIKIGFHKQNSNASFSVSVSVSHQMRSLHCTLSLSLCDAAATVANGDLKGPVWIWTVPTHIK